MCQDLLDQRVVGYVAHLALLPLLSSRLVHGRAWRVRALQLGLGRAREGQCWVEGPLHHCHFICRTLGEGRHRHRQVSICNNKHVEQSDIRHNNRASVLGNTDMQVSGSWLRTCWLRFIHETRWNENKFLMGAATHETTQICQLLFWINCDAYKSARAHEDVFQMSCFLFFLPHRP